MSNHLNCIFTCDSKDMLGIINDNVNRWWAEEINEFEQLDVLGCIDHLEVGDEIYLSEYNGTFEGYSAQGCAVIFFNLH